jgi:hypothetical protein
VAAEVYEPPGSARLELVSGVALLREEDAVVEAMLEGWAKQQLGGRSLADKTVKRRQAVVRQFLQISNEYPWHWTAAHLDEWSADLVSVLGRSKSTIRNYHDAIRSFDNYLTAPQYRWAEECDTRFGTHPVPICFESNTAAHLVDYEGNAERRPMTREELQRFFDYADDRVDRAIRSGHKGALTAYRDATVFKVIYGRASLHRNVQIGRHRLVSQSASTRAGEVRQAGGSLGQVVQRFAAQAAHRPQCHALGGRRGRGLLGQHSPVLRLAQLPRALADRTRQPDPPSTHRGTLRRVPRRAQAA